IADVTMATTATLLLAEFAEDLDANQSVGWTVLVSTVALWTITRGWAAGITLTVMSMPVSYVIVDLVDPATHTATWGLVIGSGAQCALALAGVALLRPSVWARLTLWAQAVGQAERALERARAQRVMHDTAVQTLDAIRLLAANTPATEAGDTLRRVGEIADQEVGTLRDLLVADELPERPTRDRRQEPGALAEALEKASQDVGRHGLHVVLIGTDRQGPSPTRERVEALRGAVGEALTNTAKHSGAPSATIRVSYPSGVEQGVEVVVTDRGRGFDPDTTRPGFGLRESVHARMAEVGGTAMVTSWRQGCVLVRLWVPA
ncbi:MAG: sensor histidine kinase, partial [Phycicoccus sp.]